MPNGIGVIMDQGGKVRVIQGENGVEAAWQRLMMDSYRWARKAMQGGGRLERADGHADGQDTRVRKANEGCRSVLVPCFQIDGA